MERIISAERVEDILNVFGSFDQNLHIIEKEWNVCVTDRDAELKISGEPEDVVSAEKAVQNLLMLAARGENVDEQRVRYVIGMIRSGQEDQIRELDSGVVCITAKGRPVKPKTLGQKAYVQAIRENTVTLGIGPAGTGKTYLAVAAAVAGLPREAALTASSSRDRRWRRASGSASCPAICRARSTRTCARCTTRSSICSGRRPIIPISNREISRSRRSRTCAAARWTTASSFSTRRRTPRASR